MCLIEHDENRVRRRFELPQPTCSQPRLCSRPRLPFRASPSLDHWVLTTEISRDSSDRPWQHKLQSYNFIQFSIQFRIRGSRGLVGKGLAARSVVVPNRLAGASVDTVATGEPSRQSGNRNHHISPSTCRIRDSSRFRSWMYKALDFLVTRASSDNRPIMRATVWRVVSALAARAVCVGSGNITQLPDPEGSGSAKRSNSR